MCQRLNKTTIVLKVRKKHKTAIRDDKILYYYVMTMMPFLSQKKTTFITNRGNLENKYGWPY